jgi:UDP-glucose 4-epimerase
MILLTGASGYVGSQIQQDFTEAIPCKFRLESYSDYIQELAALAKKRQKLDPITLIHCASSLTIRGDAELNPQKTLTESYNFFSALVDVFPDVHIIYPSSGGSIYKFKEKIPYSEKCEMAATTLYTQAKLCHEAYLYHLQQNHPKMKVTALRISNPYGTNLGANRKQGLIGVASRCLTNNEQMNIFADPETVRDYIHFNDLNKLIKEVISTNVEPGFDIINAGSGIGHSIQDVLSTMEEVHHKKFNIFYGPQETSRYETPWSVLNIEKAKNKYNWRPEIDLRKGLEMMKNSSLK